MLGWIAVVIGVVLLDQISKYLTILYLKPIDTVVLIEDVLLLNYEENTGMAFSMFDQPDERWIFMSISTVALSLLAVYMFAPRPRWLAERMGRFLPARPKQWITWLSLSFILGGGIGNMIDRFALEYVVDMIDVYCIDFAVFNVADSFVCIGAGLLMLGVILDTIKEVRAENARAAAVEPICEDDAHE